MRPRLAALRATAVILSILPAPPGAGAQGDRGARIWNDTSTMRLVDRAIARRSAQLADTGLADYRAVAHGYITFLAQIGEGFPDPPQVVRADELAVEVYWRAPNQSKQRVVGRRDTLMLPTDIAYHRDHLAIVQNNFPAIIRLGDGDEVRDVPHPLSRDGRDAYQFATADSLTIRVGTRSWDVVMVEVRPREPTRPRAVGAVYLDRETASVVRLSVGFTRAALIDPALEDVSVVLDNALVDARFWLPRRQEIEIRRSGTWLEFPARGIIRGEWDLCCVESNTGVPAALFAGPEIAFASPAEQKAYAFAGRLADSLEARMRTAGGDRLGTGAAAAEVQARAAKLVAAAALTKTTRAALSARRLSDFVRVNRVEGFAVGEGATVALGSRAALRGNVRYGIADRAFKHRVELTCRNQRGVCISVAAFDDFAAAGDAPESSLLGNSVGAQEFGTDFTDDYRARGFEFALSGGARWRWRASTAWTTESPLTVHAEPFTGGYRPAFAASHTEGTRARLSVGARALDGPMGSRLSVAGAWTGASQHLAASSLRQLHSRTHVDVEAEAPTDIGTLAIRVIAGVVHGEVAPQGALYFGGPVTGPGYAPHSLTGLRGGSFRAEWQVRAGSFPVSLGRFGATRVPITLLAYGHVTALAGGLAGSGSQAGWFRSVGAGVVTLHDLLRIDVARGLDVGGRWTLYADFGRIFWPVL